MARVIYQLLDGGDLGGMAPAPLPGGGFGYAALPQGMPNAPRIYMIYNIATENRYVGIAGDLVNRFTSRMAAVTELGFAAATMQNIVVWWGRVTVRDTPSQLNPNPLEEEVLPPVGGGAFTHLIDGVQRNLEHLLIRFNLRAAGSGGTVSNNQLMGEFVNGPGHPIEVTVQWGAAGPIAAGDRTEILEPNDRW